MGLFDKLFKKNEKKEKAFELGKTVHIDQIPKIHQYLNDESVEVRRAAISSLEQQYSTGDSFGIIDLKEKLLDSDAEVRAIAALALGEYIPCAKTHLAIEEGSKAIKEIFKLLETEKDKKVLANMFITLGNIDDPSIIKQFSEVMNKLEKSKIYIAIRSIGSLRPTNTRKEMITILKSLETNIDATTNGQDIADYHGTLLNQKNFNVLIALEKLISKQIPIVTYVERRTFGAIIENKQVIELGLDNIGLTSIPENIGDLTNLRVLWIANNKIKELPDSFGNLKSLETLLMECNEMTSLPDSIVNLNNLSFVRLDEKIKTNSSKTVVNWLEKLKTRLGSGNFLVN